MKINTIPHHSIWLNPDSRSVSIIDQRLLPHQFQIENITTCKEMFRAIKEMYVRGAPLIGVSAAYGLYLASLEITDVQGKTNIKVKERIYERARYLESSRPTAVNLHLAIEEQLKHFEHLSEIKDIQAALLNGANEIKDQELERSRLIGVHGFELLKTLYQEHSDRPLNIMTHCNAGWIACVDFGTATAPVYLAHDAGMPVHVWVSETRPRNQGGKLTAWELGQHGVPFTLFVDNAAGHLMQHGQVDVVIVGADRVTKSGDTANKIGTYLKALAAKRHNIPFYVALPTTTIDWSITDGVSEIEIEERSALEVSEMDGMTSDGKLQTVSICPPQSRISNFGFDVTPADLITGYITERGIVTVKDGVLDLL
jgi:methylthioribose-1-phosphate isomerase